jgi:hypothetical protein
MAAAIIGALVAVAGMDAQAPAGLEVAGCAAQQVAVCPDPADAVDRAARECQGQ